jgi:hypothetical protein
VHTVTVTAFLLEEEEEEDNIYIDREAAVVTTCVLRCALRKVDVRL